jgi:hypothetical protein
MLPAKIDSLIRDSIDVYLKKQGYRPPRFGQRLLAQSFAGEVIQPAKVAAVTAKEIEEVSSGLVTAIKNVIEKLQTSQSEDIENDLLHIFDSEFDKCADAIRKFGGDTFKRLRASESATDWFDQRLQDARQARHLELKLFAAEMLNAQEHHIKSLSPPNATLSQMSTRIFISHSSTDRELAALLVDLLRSSLDLPAEAIRCTSVEGHRLAGGAATDSALRKDIRDCEVFIGLISATSVESAYVLFELGARWGAERHLLPLLAPTAEAAILRGPLLGLNALRCSSAADLQQMIDEIATLLKISAEKPAAYQRHIEQILGWGAVETSRSESHIAVEDVQPTPQEGASGGDEYANAQMIIAKHCEEQWPDNYSMRAFCIDQEESAVQELKEGRPPDIPEDVFRRVRRNAAEQWPNQFSMRLFTEQEEYKSFRKLQERQK